MREGIGRIECKGIVRIESKGREGIGTIEIREGREQDG